MRHMYAPSLPCLTGTAGAWILGPSGACVCVRRRGRARATARPTTSWSWSRRRQRPRTGVKFPLLSRCLCSLLICSQVQSREGTSAQPQIEAIALPRRLILFLQQSSVEWCSSLWLHVIQELDPNFQRTVRRRMLASILSAHQLPACSLLLALSPRMHACMMSARLGGAADRGGQQV